MRSRLNDKENGCIILIMQRLHQDDLVGHVQEQEDWDIVNFPAIAEEEEEHHYKTIFGKGVYRRQRDELLDARRESRATLANIRKAIGDYNFEAQYQQNPVPLEGNMIKAGQLRYYSPAERPSRFLHTILSVDTAYKAKELNDYSAGVVMGAAEGKFYIIDVFRKRLEFPGLKAEIRAMAARQPYDRPCRDPTAAAGAVRGQHYADPDRGRLPLLKPL